jgi:hypothetical protein
VTVPNHYSQHVVGGSLVARLDDRYGNVQVHVWHRDVGGVTLNLEYNPTAIDENAQDVIAALSRDDTAKLIDALTDALRVSNNAHDKMEKEKQVAADAEALRSKLELAPVVGDVVLIAPDPSALPPYQRAGGGGQAARFGSQWGEVELINYQNLPGGATDPAELRAYVRVTLPGDAESKAAWLHVDYLTPVAVMARTRATATDAEATVTADWSPASVVAADVAYVERGRGHAGI